MKKIKIFFYKLRNYLGQEYWGLYEDEKINLGIKEQENYIDNIQVDGIIIPIKNINGIMRIDVGHYSLDFTKKIIETLKEKIKNEQKRK